MGRDCDGRSGMEMDLVKLQLCQLALSAPLTTSPWQASSSGVGHIKKQEI